MANPTCTRASLVENFPCLAGPVWTEKQQRLLRIWFMTQELAALGGTDYSNTLTTTLVRDAVTLARTMNSSQRRTALTAIYRNNAVAAGATIPSTPNALFDKIRCLQNAPDLEAITLLLLCKLGVHKAYPQ